MDTHFVQLLNERDMLIKRLKIILVEVTIRNIVAGGMAKLLGLEEGLEPESAVLEYHYKNDELDDPLINEYHIQALKLASESEMRVFGKGPFR